MPSPNTKAFGIGPFNGVLYTAEPYDDTSNTLNQLVNGYIPDPTNGAAVYSRPGFATLSTGLTNPQGVHLHVGTNGVAYNFLFANGLVYRVADSGALTNVTPAGITISTTAPVYARSLGDTIVVTDGVNPPWAMTSVSATPVVGTKIVFSGGTTVALRMPSITNTNIGWNALTVYVNGVQYDLTNNDLTGVALPAGTIPTAQWGVYRVSYDPALLGYTVTAGAANYTTGYASEALALVALPAVPANHGDMGYFTVRANLSNPFIAGTSALATGTGGNPASATNYYAPFTVWTAYGPPVIYAGSVFFVLKTVENGLPARSSIAWSEPNQPTVGYQQTDYDNVWELTQTGSDPLYALAATNDALYYSRQHSWGALAGTPNINFQNTASHDIVSGNVGCVSPRSVQVFLNYIYFADAQGRPYRFAVGGSPEALWTQARQYFDENVTTLTAQAVEASALSVVEPNLNVWVLALPGLTGPDTPLIFDAMTGTYAGQWEGTGDTSGDWLTCGIFCTNPASLGGAGRQLVFARGTTLARVTLRSDNIWKDTATGPATGFIPVTATGSWMGFSLKEKVQVNEVRALLGGTVLGDEPGATTGIQLLASTTQTIEATGFTPPIAPVSGGIPRYVRPSDMQVFGRGARIVVRFYTSTQQAQIYRMEMEGVASQVTIRDR